MLAAKDREDISIFLFHGRKRIEIFGQFYPLLIIYQINIPLKGAITHSTEARVKLDVTHFLEDFFLSYKTVSFVLEIPRLK